MTTVNPHIKVQLDTTVVPEDYYAGNPSKLIGDAPMIFEMERFELVPGVGALTYIKNATHPRKGMPAVEIIYSVNIMKEITKQAFKYPTVLLRPEKAMKSFNEIFDKVMGHFKVNHKYFCMCPRMVWYSTSKFFTEMGISVSVANNFGYNFAHFFEFDDAYRFILQDVATEMNIVDLRKNPRKEIKRLIKIMYERQPKEKRGVIDKIMLLLNPLLLVLLIPKFKRAFIEASVYFKGMEFDEMDLYWVAFKDQYKFCGKTQEERAEGLPVPVMYVYTPHETMPEM